MREQRVTLPELALVAGTRVVLGAGLGLLGALSTIPLAIEVLGKREALPAQEPRGVIGTTGTVNLPGQP